MRARLFRITPYIRSAAALFTNYPDKSEFVGEFARRYNSEWLPLEGELADARYERMTEEVCGEFWVRR